MDMQLLTRVLAQRAELTRHDHWTRAHLVTQQAAALEQLRRFASARSPFYRREHAALRAAPLSELPAVTKEQLMSHFDTVLTTRSLSLADLERHLRHLTDTDGDPGQPFRERWWAAATAGTTGRRGVFAWNRSEWATVLASYSRALVWAGVHAGPRHHVRTAVVSSTVPTHQSAVVGASITSRMIPTLRLDARGDLTETIASLNTFRPDVLVGYASILRPLATAQQEGRLRIAPRAVMSASEILTDRAAHEMAHAWRTRPFDVYAATETAGIASTCSFGTRHLYDDLVIVEPVDHAGDPVPAGSPGARVLVTVLFSRTLPLIRYELSDRVTLSTSPCPCGRPFGVLERVEGREEDVLTLPGSHGPVTVHPNVFSAALDDADVVQWQIIQEADGVRVLLITRGGDSPMARVQQRLGHALDEAGAYLPPLRMERVDRIPRTPLGKTPLIRKLVT